MFFYIIFLVLNKVKTTLVNTVIRLEYVLPDSNCGIGIKIQIDKYVFIDFYFGVKISL